MKHRKHQQQQHRIHQKVGIINRIRKRRRKRKVKHHHQNRIILHRINNQQHLLLLKIHQKNQVVSSFSAIQSFKFLFIILDDDSSKHADGKSNFLNK